MGAKRAGSKSNSSEKSTATVTGHQSSASALQTDAKKNGGGNDAKRKSDTAPYMYILQSTDHQVIRLDRDVISKELKVISLCNPMKTEGVTDSQASQSSSHNSGPSQTPASQVGHAHAASHVSQPPSTGSDSDVAQRMSDLAQGRDSFLGRSPLHSTQTTTYCREWATFVYKKWLASLAPPAPSTIHDSSHSTSKANIPTLRKSGTSKKTSKNSKSAPAERESNGVVDKASEKTFVSTDSTSARKETVSELCLTLARRLTDQVHWKKAARRSNLGAAQSDMEEKTADVIQPGTCLESLVSLATSQDSSSRSTGGPPKAQGAHTSGQTSSQLRVSRRDDTSPVFSIENVVDYLNEWINTLPEGIAQPEMFRTIDKFADITDFLQEKDDESQILSLFTLDNKGQLVVTKDKLPLLQSLSVSNSSCAHSRSDTLLPPALEEHRQIVNEGITTTSIKCRTTLLDEIDGVWKYLRMLMAYAPEMIALYRHMVTEDLATVHDAFQTATTNVARSFPIFWSEELQQMVERDRGLKVSVGGALDNTAALEKDLTPQQIDTLFEQYLSSLECVNESFMTDVFLGQEPVYKEFFIKVEKHLDEIMAEVREIILVKQRMFESQHDVARAEWCARVAQACLSPTGHLAGGTLTNLVDLGFQRARLLMKEKHEALLADVAEARSAVCGSHLNRTQKLEKLKHKEFRKALKKMEARAEHHRGVLMTFLAEDLVAEEEILGRFIMLLNAVLCEGSFAEQQLLADYLHSLQETQQHITTRKHELLDEYAEGIYVGISQLAAVLSKVLTEEAVRLKEEDLAEMMQRELLRELAQEEEAAALASEKSKRKKGGTTTSSMTTAPAATTATTSIQLQTDPSSKGKKKGGKSKAKVASTAEAEGQEEEAADPIAAPVTQASYMTPSAGSHTSTPIAGRSTDMLPLSFSSAAIAGLQHAGTDDVSPGRKRQPGLPPPNPETTVAGLPSSGASDDLIGMKKNDTSPKNIAMESEAQLVIASLRGELKTLRISHEASMSQQADLSSRFNASYADLQKAKATITGLQRDVASANAALNESHRNKERALHAVEKEAQDYRNMLEVTKRELESARKLNRALEKQVKDQRRDIDRLAKQNQPLQQQQQQQQQPKLQSSSQPDAPRLEQSYHPLQETTYPDMHGSNTAQRGLLSPSLLQSSKTASKKTAAHSSAPTTPSPSPSTSFAKVTSEGAPSTSKFNSAQLAATTTQQITKPTNTIVTNLASSELSSPSLHNAMPHVMTRDALEESQSASPVRSDQYLRQTSNGSNALPPRALESSAILPHQKRFDPFGFAPYETDGVPFQARDERKDLASHQRHSQQQPFTQHSTSSSSPHVLHSGGATAANSGYHSTIVTDPVYTPQMDGPYHTRTGTLSPIITLADAMPTSTLPGGGPAGTGQCDSISPSLPRTLSGSEATTFTSTSSNNVRPHGLAWPPGLGAAVPSGPASLGLSATNGVHDVSGNVGAGPAIMDDAAYPRRNRQQSDQKAGDFRPTSASGPSTLPSAAAHSNTGFLSSSSPFAFNAFGQAPVQRQLAMGHGQGPVSLKAGPIGSAPPMTSNVKQNSAENRTISGKTLQSDEDCIH